jgi:hypothetical protein
MVKEVLTITPGTDSFSGKLVKVPAARNVTKIDGGNLALAQELLSTMAWS